LQDEAAQRRTLSLIIGRLEDCVFRRKAAGHSGLSRTLCGVWRR
jgi:hypothetical protein